MRLLAWPQVQVLVLPLEMVVAGGGVVVDTGEGVVVEARYVIIVFKVCHCNGKHTGCPKKILKIIDPIKL